jgi:hypothetical protein
MQICIPKESGHFPQGGAILRDRRGVRVFNDPRLSFADCCRRAERSAIIQTEAELVQVGWWDVHLGEARVLPGRERALSIWIKRAVNRNQLEARDSLHNQRSDARQEMRRALMQGNTAKASQLMQRHNLRHW